MNRRTLIKTLGISAVGLATVPLWIDSWTTEDLPEDNDFLTGEQRLQLHEIVGTLIPETDTPGAKELGVDKYISIMVKDCYNEEIKEEFLSGFGELNSYSKSLYGNSFMEITEAERIEVLGALAVLDANKEKKINFVAFVKDLTIAGFMSSQYVMENHLNYELVPGRFNGSFPVTKSIYTNV